MINWNFLQEGLLFRQFYNWLKGEHISSLQTYKVFKGKLDSKKYAKAFEPLLQWIEKGEYELDSLVEWLLKQQLVAILCFSFDSFFLEIQPTFPAIFKEDLDSAEVRFSRLALIDFSIMAGVGITRTTMGRKADKNLEFIFEYLGFLKKTYRTQGKTPLINLFSFLEDSKQAKSTTHLSTLFAKAQARGENEEPNVSVRTLNRIKEGKKVDFSSLRELAKGISNSKNEQNLITIIFLIAHGAQYALSNHELKDPPYWLQYLFQLPDLWKLDAVSAAQRSEQFLKDSILPREWQHSASQFIGQLFQPSNSLIVLKGNSMFPFPQSQPSFFSFFEGLVLFPRAWLLMIFGQKLLEENSQEVMYELFGITEEMRQE